MNHRLNPGRPTRIADYFVVIGATDELVPLAAEDQPIHNCTSAVNLVYNAEITDRYPLEDRSDASFPSGLTLFSFPNSIEVRTESRPPTFFSFVQTSETGAHMLGCCLIFHEHATPKQRQCLVSLAMELQGEEEAEKLRHCKLLIPRCLCLISRLPFVSSFKKFLCNLYRISLSQSPIPIERYICNFLDDVPAPPPGRVEVSVYIGDHPVTFRCPPANQPHVWSSLPMHPLFECLSIANILTLFSSIIAERQIVFISSQYSLLTYSAEVITSLLYPLTWTHVYIPILPRRLIGVLQAPLPFIVGIHSSFLKTDEVQIADETVRVFLDENRIEVGCLGHPPVLPDRPRRKLINVLDSVGGHLFNNRDSAWAVQSLPYYDSAFEMSVRPDLANGTSEQGKAMLDEKAVREAFLRFFVAIMKNYRQYLIFGTASDPFPLIKFRQIDYLEDHPSDWAPFLKEMLRSQAFTQFVEARVSSVSTDPDIIFFDESIDAKFNRYTFKLLVRDTPFLHDNTNKHVKTYVAPAPDADQLPDPSAEEEAAAVRDKSEDDGRNAKIEVRQGKRYFVYSRFPNLRRDYYATARNTTSQHLLVVSPTLAKTTVGSSLQSRLKRLPMFRGAPASNATAAANPSACVFSAFLVVFTRVITRGFSAPSVRRAPPSVTQLLDQFQAATPRVSESYTSAPALLHKSETDEDFSSQRSVSMMAASTGDIPSDLERVTSALKARRHSVQSGTSGRSRSVSGSSGTAVVVSGGGSPFRTRSGFKNYTENIKEEFLTAARAAIEIAFEVFSVMIATGFTPDEIVYRSLADACAACGAGLQAVYLLEVMMTVYGVLPDAAIYSAVAKAISFTDKSLGGMNDALTYPQEDVERRGCVVSTNDITEAATAKDWKRLYGWIGGTKRRPSIHAHPLQRTMSETPFATSPAAMNSRSASIAAPPNNSTSPTSRFFGNTRQNSSYFNERRGSGVKGLAPSVEWCDISQVPIAASTKFCTQVLLADRTLDMMFPDLVVNLNHKYGTYCPKCGHANTLCDLYASFDADPNKYTVKCRHEACGKEFVPRFTVKSSASDWIGSEGPGTELWCELLSPWTLQKEMLTVLVNDGIEAMLCADFRNSSVNAQNAVVFWNMIVAFRVHGLPYVFMICDTLSMAFMVPLDC